MLIQKFKFQESVRFHARPAARIVEAAQKFNSTIALASGGYIADARRVFSVMKIAVPKDSVVEVIVEGSDEDAAMTEIEKVIKNMDWR